MVIKKSVSAVLYEYGRMELQEFDLPSIGPDDGLLRIEMVGVCGTDPGMYSGKLKSLGIGPPLIMGHELVGHIEEVGENAAKLWGVSVGDRVVVEPKMNCGKCEMCLSGNYRLCHKGYTYGATVKTDIQPSLWGGYGQYMYLAPGAMVHKISEHVPAEEATLICAVIANGIRWVREIGGVRIGDTVVIIGPGQQGLAATIAANEAGASRIIVIGLSEDKSRLKLAKEFGATDTIIVDAEDPLERVREITIGRLADVVVEVSGSHQGVSTSIRLVKKMGTVVLGGLTGSKPIPDFISDIITANEIIVRGARSHDFRSVIPAIKIVEEGRYPLSKMITHRFSLDQAERAVQTMGRMIPGEDPIKVVISPWD